MCAKTTACIIARTVSKRLPLKAFRLMDRDTTMLDYIIQRVKKCKRVDEIYVCTSAEAVDDIMEDYAWKNDVKCYRGSADEVIERMISVGQKTKSDYVIRITGDNVFTSYEYIDQQIQLAVDKNLDYVRVGGVPIGATAEVMSFAALQKCFGEMDPTVSEYLMLFMFNPDAYKCGVVKPFKKDYSSLTLTVDYPNDLVRTMEIFKHVDSKNFLELKLKEIIDIIEKHKVPHAHLEQSGTVKLPYGKEVTYQDFALDMNDRVARSIQIEL